MKGVDTQGVEAAVNMTDQSFVTNWVELLRPNLDVNVSSGMEMLDACDRMADYIDAGVKLSEELTDKFNEM